MAKRIKFNPTYNKREQKVDTLFEEILKELPEETRQEMESMGIHSFDELYEMMLSVGIDPMKMMDYSMKHKEIPADFNPKDVMFDEEEYFDEEDDDFDDGDENIDEDYLIGMKLPERKFIGPSKREFLIRI